MKIQKQTTLQEAKWSAKQTLGMSLVALACGISMLPFAAAAERVNPLVVQIPSLPEETAKVDVIDNDLAVQLLDAQVEPLPEKRSISPSSNLPAIPDKASGNVFLGAKPKTVKIEALESQVEAKKEVSKPTPSVAEKPAVLTVKPASPQILAPAPMPVLEALKKRAPINQQAAETAPLPDVRKPIQQNAAISMPVVAPEISEVAASKEPEVANVSAPKASQKPSLSELIKAEQVTAKPIQQVAKVQPAPPPVPAPISTPTLLQNLAPAAGTPFRKPINLALAERFQSDSKTADMLYQFPKVAVSKSSQPMATLVAEPNVVAQASAPDTLKLQQETFDVLQSKELIKAAAKEIPAKKEIDELDAKYDTVKDLTKTLPQQNQKQLIANKAGNQQKQSAVTITKPSELVEAAGKNAFVKPEQKLAKVQSEAMQLANIAPAAGDMKLITNVSTKEKINEQIDLPTLNNTEPTKVNPQQIEPMPLAKLNAITPLIAGKKQTETTEVHADESAINLNSAAETLSKNLDQLDLKGQPKQVNMASKLAPFGTPSSTPWPSYNMPDVTAEKPLPRIQQETPVTAENNAGKSLVKPLSLAASASTTTQSAVEKPTRILQEAAEETQSKPVTLARANTSGELYEKSNGTTLAELAPAAGPTEIIKSQPIPVPYESATLPEDTKKMLRRIPSNIDAPKKSGAQKVKIDREHVNPVALGGAGTELAAQHESLGMKIEIRRPMLDVNQELQQAYNAVVSGQNDLALAIYDRVLDYKPSEINALYGKATLLHQAGALSTAKEYYQRVLRQDADHREALNNFLSLVAEEAPMEALTELLKLQKKNPQFSPIPAQISLVYQKLGDYRSAIQAMLDAHGLAPENLTYILNLAVMLDKLGVREKAANYYQMLNDAHLRGVEIPGNIRSIQERLTFIRSNR